MSHNITKKAQVTTPSIRFKALAIFNQPKFKFINHKDLAQTIGVSLRRFYKMKKEFKQTGDIKLTDQYRHRKNYLEKSVQENRIIINMAKSQSYISTKQIQTQLKKNGYDVSVAQITSRLCRFGLNPNNLTRQYEQLRPIKKIQNQKQLLEIYRQQFQDWLELQNKQELVYVDLLSFSSERKTKTKHRFQIILTVGFEGVIGWNIFENNKLNTRNIQTHLHQNFISVSNQFNSLIVGSDMLFRSAQINDYLSQNKIPFYYLPNQSKQLSPIQNIYKYLKVQIETIFSEKNQINFDNIQYRLEQILYQFPQKIISEFYFEVERLLTKVQRRQ